MIAVEHNSRLAVRRSHIEANVVEGHKIRVMDSTTRRTNWYTTPPTCHSWVPACYEACHAEQSNEGHRWLAVASDPQAGFRVELAPTSEQTVAMGRHAGSAVVENFALETVIESLNQRSARETYGILEEQLTRFPGPLLLWRLMARAHPHRFPGSPIADCRLAPERRHAGRARRFKTTLMPSRAIAKAIGWVSRPGVNASMAPGSATTRPRQTADIRTFGSQAS